MVEDWWVNFALGKIPSQVLYACLIQFIAYTFSPVSNYFNHIKQPLQLTRHNASIEFGFI